MAYTDHFENVQKLYIAYYQRPADPQGLVAWAKRIEEAGDDEVKFNTVLDAFATSPESKALYGGDIGLDNIGAAVRKMYQGLLGVDGDREGRDFYIKKFNDGEYTAGQVAWKILDGAQDGTGTDATKDRTTIDNKVKVANIFTEKVAGKPMADPDFPSGKGPWNFAYDGEDAAKEARDYLAKVTDKSASVPTANVVEKFIIDSNYIAGKDVPGVGNKQYTHTLKVGDDSYTGGNYDDYVYAPVDNMNSSLSSDANLDGGIGGHNKLRVEMAGSNGSALAPGAKIKNFHELEVVVKSLATTDNGVLSVNTNSTAKEVGKITIDGNTNNISVYGSENLETVVYDERGKNSSTIRGDKIKEILIGEYTGGGDINVYTKNDTAKVDVEFATVSGKYSFAGGVKNVAVDQNGVPRAAFITVDKDVESLKITGDVNDLKDSSGAWGVDLPSVGASLTTIDISDLSLGLGDTTSYFSMKDNFAEDTAKPINLLLGSGHNRIDVDRSIAAGSTIKFGAGNDYLLSTGGGVINGNVEVIDGGAGTDRVSLSLINASNAKQFKNFEIVNVNGASSGIHDITGMEFDSLELSDLLGNNLNIKGLGNDTVFNVINDSGKYGNFGTANTVTLDNKNNLTLNYVNSTAASTVTLNSKDTSNLFINNNSNNKLSATIQLDDLSDLESITVKGNSDVEINDSVGNSVKHIKKIDGSGLTGALTIDGSNNRLSDSNLTEIIGGSKNDTIILGKDHGNVKLTGGSGDDTFNVANNFASKITTTPFFTGVNEVTDFSKGDTINVGTVVNTGLFGGATVLPSAISNENAALNHASVNTSVVNQLNWFNYGNNTYIIKSDGTAGLDVTGAGADVVIKLPGTIDLTGKLTVDGSGNITFAP